jgi:hypothetical protein
LGRALFAALFSGEVLDRYLQCRFFLGDEVDRGLRVRLSFDPSRPGQLALCALPWELLRDASAELSLALDRRLAVVRQLDLRRPVRRPPFEPPARILVLASNPPATKLLNLEEEIRQIEAAWKGSGQVRVLREATLAGLREELVSTPFHYLHFSGHGTLPTILGQGAIVFHHPEGRLDQVAGHELVTILRDHATLRLAVVNACWTAAVGSEPGPDPMAGIAAALALGEVPCVVAQQLHLEDTAAILFGATLHRRLAAGDPIEAAVVEARLALFESERNRKPATWATPALFCQLQLGEEPPWRHDRVSVRRALETLSHDRFVAVARDFNPDLEVPVAANAPHRELPSERRSQAERVLSLAAERGEEAWIDLQDSILAARSPSSPFDGSRRGWVSRPPKAWQITAERLVGVGLGSTRSFTAPDELREASLLLWEELRFRDGAIRVRLWLPLLRKNAGAGLVLGHREGRGMLLGLLRSSTAEAPAAEIWHRGSLGWRRLAAAQIPDPDGDRGSHELELRVQGAAVELRIHGASLLSATSAAEFPAGHAGLMRLGATAVEARDLVLTVRRRRSPSPLARPTGLSVVTSEET